MENTDQVVVENEHADQDEEVGEEKDNMDCCGSGCCGGK
tara:strand:+ start:2151 stop:2267 length:117 start_codon:yes stop_codon:yes gene_type:complete